MRDEDLEPFAVADGLLAKMEDQPPAGQVTDTERQWMLDQARQNLARVLNVSVEVAGRELHAAAAQGHLTEQYSATLAMVSLKGPHPVRHFPGRAARRRPPRAQLADPRSVIIPTISTV
jgi:hypothetical protein